MATFLSKIANLKLVIEPTMARVENGRQYIVYGKHIQFKDGTYHTVKPDEITFMRNHTAKGRLFYESEEKDYHKIDKIEQEEITKKVLAKSRKINKEVVVANS